MIDPVAINLGTIQIRWYGIIMALSFVIAYFMIIKLAKQRNIPKETITDYFLYFIPASIIGARLLAVILNHENYSSFYDIIAVWQGGMAIHGGIIATVLVTLYFCKKRNLHFYDISDILVIPVALGLTLGRIGNFINQEFIGKPTNLPWGVYFDNITEKRHPSQIYESLKNFLIFSITIKLYAFKKLKRGTITWVFLLLYSTLRFLIEFVKEMPTWYELTYGQIVSIPIIILSIIMLWRIGKNNTVNHNL
ncbi:prolipoprotein diacylglyceryl transferase [archaeon]|nr:prolipoprotein diacylglyceryl transferase [archaeon]